LKPHLQTTVLDAAGGRESQPARDPARHRNRSQDDPRPGAAFCERRGKFPRGGHRPSRSNSPTPATGARDPAIDFRLRTASRLHRGAVTARRNFTAIYQDLVDQHGFTAATTASSALPARCVAHEPEQFDRLGLRPRRRDAGRLRRRAPTLHPGTERYRKPRLFVA
jgi:hypothetical protein